MTQWVLTGPVVESESLVGYSSWSCKVVYNNSRGICIGSHEQTHYFACPAIDNQKPGFKVWQKELQLGGQDPIAWVTTIHAASDWWFRGCWATAYKKPLTLARMSVNRKVWLRIGI